MGAKNRFGFTVVIEDTPETAEFTNRVRIQVCVSGDGTLGESGPFHRWADIHSHYDETEERWVLDDEPITGADAKAIRTIRRIALMRAEYGFSLDLTGQLLIAVTTAAWGQAVSERIWLACTGGSQDPAEWQAAADGLLGVEAAKAAAAGVTL